MRYKIKSLSFDGASAHPNLFALVGQEIDLEPAEEIIHEMVPPEGSKWHIVPKGTVKATFTSKYIPIDSNPYGAFTVPDLKKECGHLVRNKEIGSSTEECATCHEIIECGTDVNVFQQDIERVAEWLCKMMNKQSIAVMRYTVTAKKLIEAGLQPERLT